MTAVNHISIDVPADCFTPGKTFGDSQASLRITAPYSMTPERFREIVKAKGGKMGVACYASGLQFGKWVSGPVLSGTWIESGVEVYFTGVVENEVRDAA